jgi:group I intron endonuclease
MTTAKIGTNSIPGIYAIYRVGTDDCYVGQSVNMRKRWNTHRQDFRKNRHASRFMQRIFNKYGEEVFEFRVLESCHIEDLTAREQSWMARLRPKYNVCPAAGSCLGYKHSEKTREKHRVDMLGNKHAAGRTSPRPPHKPESIAKMSAAKKGKPNYKRRGKRHSPESIALMSANRTGIPSQFKGIPRSEEVKQKISMTKRAAAAAHIAPQFQQELPL